MNVFGLLFVSEKGYGVRDAVKEVKELRSRNGVCQKEINSLVQKVNDMESQVCSSLYPIKCNMLMGADLGHA